MAANLVQLRGWLDGFLEQRALSTDEARQLLVDLTDAELPPALAGALLAAIRAKGVTAGDMRAFALGTCSLARRPAIADTTGAVDIVSTGGDKSGSFNLSTGA